MKILILLLLMMSFGFTVSGQTDSIKFASGKSEKFAASSITWVGHLGSRKEEPYNMYSLMAQGGFRSPTSSNLKDLVRNWLKKHPKAKSVLVYSLEGILTAEPKSKMKAVWLVDGNENLNLYLVRNGACPAGTMVLNPGDETPLAKKDYEAFEMKVWEAQKAAKLEKIGIWAETKPAS